MIYICLVDNWVRYDGAWPGAGEHVRWAGKGTDWDRRPRCPFNWPAPQPPPHARQAHPPYSRPILCHDPRAPAQTLPPLASHPPRPGPLLPALRQPVLVSRFPSHRARRQDASPPARWPLAPSIFSRLRLNVPVRLSMTALPQEEPLPASDRRTRATHSPERVSLGTVRLHARPGARSHLLRRALFSDDAQGASDRHSLAPARKAEANSTHAVLGTRPCARKTSSPPPGGVASASSQSNNSIRTTV